MSKRAWFVSIGSGMLFLAGSLALTVLLLLSTDRGSAWTVNKAVQYLNRSPELTVSFQGLSGNLAEGLGTSELAVLVTQEGSETEVTIHDLDLRWTLPALLAKQIHIRSLSATLVTIDVTTFSGPSPEPSPEPFDIREFIQQVFSLPVDVRIARASIDRMALVIDGSETEIAIRSLQADLDQQKLELTNTDFSIANLSVNTPALSLQSDRQLSGTASWGVELDATALEGELQVSGSLDSINVENSLTQPHAVETSGLFNGLLDDAPAFELRHEAQDLPDFLNLPDSITDNVQAASLSLATSGTFSRIDFTGTSEFVLLNRPPINAAFSGELQTSGQLTIERLELREDTTVVMVSGSLDSFSPLQGQWQWQLNADELSGLPGNLVLSGLAGEGQFAHDQSDTGVYEGQLQWQLQGEQVAGLPMGIRMSAFDGQGTLEFSQSPANGLSLDAAVSNLDAMLNGQALILSGEGNIENQRLENFELELLQGQNHLSMQGSLNENLDLDADIDVKELGSLVPDLAGVIAGNLHLSGSIETPSVAVDLRGSALSLILDAQEYSLASASIRGSLSEEQSRLVFNLGNFQAPQTDMQLTSLALAFDGTMASHTFDLNAETRPGTLQMSGRGEYMNGSLQTVIDNSVIQSEWGNWRLDDNVQLELAADEVSVSQHCWLYTSLELCATGNWNDGNSYDAALTLTGLPLAWLNTQASLDSIQRPGISQKVFNRPAALERLQTDYGVFLPPQSFLDGEISLEADVSGTASSWSADLAMIPGQAVAGLIRPPGINEVTEVASDANGEVPIETYSQEPEISLFTLEYRQVQAQHNAEGWKGSVDMVVSQESSPGLTLQSSLVADLSLDNNEQLDGTINLDLPALDWLESVIPVLKDPRGALIANIIARGTLDRPLLESRVTLREGHADLPAYGLSLDGLALDMTSNDNNNFRFSGAGNSGEGNMSFSGELNTPFLPERSLSLSLQGENFQVLNLADRQVSLTPDITLALNQEVLNVNGTIRVPVFRLTLDEETLGNNRVSVSRDVYIKREEETGLVAERSIAEEVRSIPVTGKVELILGDEVRFSGLGLNMKLEGSFALEQPLDRALRAYGEVDVAEGSYELYGQRLETEEGKLLFLGNPANPALDIRATREVEETTVGIQISGTLNNITSQLYSTPVMPESEVLSMLITGKSLDRPSNDEGDAMLAAIANLGIEQGQGITSSVQEALGLDSIAVSGGSNLHDSSVGLGKYITPDLYMQYKFGIYERESVLSMDYRLTKRLKLEVETGISQSIDLTYTVEK